MGLWDSNNKGGGLFGGGSSLFGSGKGHSGGGIFGGKGGLFGGGRHEDGVGMFDEAHKAHSMGSHDGMWDPINPFTKRVKSGLWDK